MDKPVRGCQGKDNSFVPILNKYGSLFKNIFAGFHPNSQVISPPSFRGVFLCVESYERF